MATLFVLQDRVLTSPKVQIGTYLHPAEYKGQTFYLSDSLFSVWTTLEFACNPLWASAVLLGMFIAKSEYRIKRRRWDALLDKMEG